MGVIVSFRKDTYIYSVYTRTAFLYLFIGILVHHQLQYCSTAFGFVFGQGVFDPYLQSTGLCARLHVHTQHVCACLHSMRKCSVCLTLPLSCFTSAVKCIHAAG